MPLPIARRRRVACLALSFAIALPAHRCAAELFAVGSLELKDGGGGNLTPGSAFAGDSLGRTLASGDFNGDGRDDLAIAEMNSLTSEAEGAVRIVYAGIDGLLGSGSLPLVLVYDFLPASGAFDREAFDFFGESLAVGDFNCDGRDDLAIGIPGEDVAGQSDAGAVLVLYGSAIGLLTANVQGLEPQRFTEGLPSTGGTITSDEHFGFALSAGNFDATSGDDLAVGIPGDTGRRGSVVVLYSAAGCQRLGSATPQIWTQDSAGIADSREAGDAFGRALAAGDFDGDGADDLVIGVPGEDIEAQVDAGAVHVLQGASLTGLSAAGSQLWTELLVDAGGFIEANDRFGEVFATGDLDADGFDDLAIGVPAEDVSFHPDAGSVTVIYGAASGLEPDGSTILDQASVLDGESLGDFDSFGFSLAIGDLVGGPGNDLAIGIPQEFVTDGLDTHPFAGAVSLVPGGGATLGLSDARLWWMGRYASAGTLRADEYYGESIVVGDFDGDGNDDAAIGAVRGEGVDPGGNFVTSGACYVLYGALFADGFATQGVSRWSDSEGCADCRPSN